jgi:hypothetical protein
MSNEEKPTTDEEESTALSFSLSPVKQKPNRKYRKGSKYDPLLDAFLSGDQNLVTVTIKDKDANYIRTQLNKRIDAQKEAHPRKFRNIEVSVVNDVCYLEKVTPKPK